MLATRIATAITPVLLVDDIRYLDACSLAVLEAVRSHIDVPLICTTEELLQPHVCSTAVLKHGREVQVALEPLDLHQVKKLLLTALGKPVDRMTVAYVHRVSGGIPRLVVRIAEAAVSGQLLKAKNGVLGMTGDSLWSVHLRGAAESLLSSLNAGEVNTLHALALVEPTDLGTIKQITDADLLLRLEQAGFISWIDDAAGESLMRIKAPLLGEYFRHDPGFQNQRILRSRISRALGNSSNHDDTVPSPSPWVDESMAKEIISTGLWISSPPTWWTNLQVRMA